MKISILAFITVILWAGCSESKKTDIEQINDTIKEALNHISDSNYTDFKRMIYNSGSNEEMLIFNFNMAHYCLSIEKESIDSLKYFFSETPMIDGSLKVTIPILHHFDSSTGIISAEIEVYFGPKQFVSLKQMSFFYVNKNIHVPYRSSLFKTGKSESIIPDDSSTPSFHEFFIQ